MILFVGLNDWIIRNMISSGFKDKIKDANLPMMGLLYKENYDIYKDELESNLGMNSLPMETKQWAEYGSRLKGAGRYLDYASVSKLARVNNNTIRTQKRGNVSDSFYKKLKLDVKFGLLKLFGFIGFEEKFIKRFERSLTDLDEYKKAVSFLKENDVKMVISCSPETPYDTNWLIAARDLGIKTYAWIRSWDNITSKISYLPETTGLFVWSTLMEDEFRKYYPGYKKTEVYKTGAVQFDGHANASNIMSREDFCRFTGLDPKRKFITYTTGGPHICEDEHLIIEEIAERIEKMNLTETPQILVRVHPYSWRTNLKLEFNHPGIISWPPPKMYDELKGGQTKGLLNDYQIMLSTFYYQTLNINIASTVTIDSCMFDKPVINIAFDPKPVKHYEKSIARYYEFDHYKPLVEIGGVRVAYNIDEFLKLFEMYYNNPEIDYENRKKIVQFECGDADGKAGERFAKKIIEIYNSN